MSFAPFAEFKTSDGSLSVIALLDDPPILSDGYGGWQIQAVPRRVGFTEWIGKNPFTLTVSVVISKWKQQQSVEAEISRLERMSQPIGHEPPIIHVLGPAMGWIATQPWVINNLEWGKVLRLIETGSRSHAEVKLTLIQHVDPKIIVKKAPKAKVRYYRVRKSDFPNPLHKIAKRLLHNANRWKEIAKLNKLRSEKQIKVGTKLKIPVK